MKKILTVLLALMMIVVLGACGEQEEEEIEVLDEATVYKVGICNYVDDASLNQIVENIKIALADESVDYKFEIIEDNCNADAAVLEQIIANFIAEDVDLMIGVATPVAMAMQAATEENQIPVVFAAVSDPIGAGLVGSLESPEANITGTSDYLDTNAVMNLITAVNPDIDTVGLLYDLGQDSSLTAIAEAKEYLDENGIAYKEYTGTNTSEISLAVDSLIQDGVKAVFTPSDNTVMAAELTIYEKLAEAGVQHYAGADSFALNGAFIGYGVDYANLGQETGHMAAQILKSGVGVDGTAVMTFDNGIATYNTDICAVLGLDETELEETLAPYCTKVQPIATAESFE